jgi:hypothetical protein
MVHYYFIIVKCTIKYQFKLVGKYLNNLSKKDFNFYKNNLIIQVIVMINNQEWELNINVLCLYVEKSEKKIK